MAEIKRFNVPINEWKELLQKQTQGVADSNNKKKKSINSDQVVDSDEATFEETIYWMRLSVEDKETKMKIWIEAELSKLEVQNNCKYDQETKNTYLNYWNQEWVIIISSIITFILIRQLYLPK